MKITTNFVRPAQRATLPIVAALWLLTIVFAAGIWWLFDDASGLRSELPDLRQRLANIKVAGRDAAVQTQQMPSVQELAQTRERVAKINATTQTKGITTLSLLTELETQLPPQAWLVSLHHRATDGEVLLVVAAATSVPLSGFLHKLERNPLFAEAMLMRELQSSGAGKTDVQYEIRLKVRS